MCACGSRIAATLGRLRHAASRRRGLGYTVAPPRIVPALEMLAVNSYTCVAEFTQHAAIEALKDREGTTPRMVREFAKRREQFIRDLNRVPGFRCLPPEGAFYAWVNISETGVSAEELCRIMLEEGRCRGNPRCGIRGGWHRFYPLFVRVFDRHVAGSRGADSASVFQLASDGCGAIARIPAGYSLRNQDRPGDFMRRRAQTWLCVLYDLWTISISLWVRRVHCLDPTCSKSTNVCSHRSKRFRSLTITRIPHSPTILTLMPWPHPPGSAALRERDTNPELVAAAKALFGYPYDDLAPEHAKWLVQKKAELRKERGNAYFSDILDKLNIEQGVANRAMMADYLDPKRFVWVFFADSFMWPFDNRRATLPQRGRRGLHSAAGEDAASLDATGRDEQVAS